VLVEARRLGHFLLPHGDIEWDGDRARHRKWNQFFEGGADKMV